MIAIANEWKQRKKKKKSEREGNFFHVDSIRIKYERQIYFCHAFIDSRSFYDK